MDERCPSCLWHIPCSVTKAMMVPSAWNDAQGLQPFRGRCNNICQPKCDSSCSVCTSSYYKQIDHSERKTL